MAIFAVKWNVVSEISKVLLTIVGNPHPLLEGGKTFQKLSHLGWSTNFLLGSGDKPGKGEGA